jgi:antitoxin CcdA
MTHHDGSARKRPVNLTLNEDLVAKARGLTPNLSAVVERLLAEYVEREGATLAQRQQALATAIEMWNAHGARHGSLADEYSPL